MTQLTSQTDFSRTFKQEVTRVMDGRDRVLVEFDIDAARKGEQAREPQLADANLRGLAAAYDWQIYGPVRIMLSEEFLPNGSQYWYRLPKALGSFEFYNSDGLLVEIDLPIQFVRPEVV